MRADRFHNESKDTAIYDLNPIGSLKMNEKLSTDSKTYYFSYTAGYDTRISAKPREIMKTHLKTSDLAVGYDIEID